MSTDGLELDGGVPVPVGWDCSVFPVESQDSMSAPALKIDRGGEVQQDGDGGRFEVCSEATSGWTRRLGNAPDEREMNPDRKTTLELSARAYAEKVEGHVVNPKVGTSFDSLDEAYEFYNLYSWETGFGIRLAKSRLNVKCTRCMQEIVCICAVCTWGHTIEREQPFVKVWVQCNDKAVAVERCWLVHYRSTRPQSGGTKKVICPQRSDLPKAPRKLPKCTNCGVVGHRRNACRNACGTKKSGPFEPNFF